MVCSHAHSNWSIPLNYSVDKIFNLYIYSFVTVGCLINIHFSSIYKTEVKM
jgi:hypothetical protein